jgi:hypothetical protein
VEDVALYQRFAIRRKARLRVKCDGVVLRIERNAREPAPARILDERVEQLASEPPSAIVGKDCHAPNLRGRAFEPIVSSGRNRFVAVANESVTRITVRAIVLVDLFFRRYVLFINKYHEPNNLCGAHPFAIVNIK